MLLTIAVETFADALELCAFAKMPPTMNNKTDLDSILCKRELAAVKIGKGGMEGKENCADRGLDT